MDAGVRQLPVSFIRKISEEACHFGAMVNLSGGEPLLYQHLDEALSVISKYRLLSYLSTNGLILEKKAKSLLKGNLNIIQISLDGWDEESQFKRGQVSGSFDAIFSGIKFIRSLKGADLFPIIRIVTVITKNNFHSLERIHRKIHEWGINQWVINNYQFVTEQAVEKHQAFKLKTGIGDFIVGDRLGNRSYFSDVEIVELKKSLARVRNEQKHSGMRIYYNWSTDLDAYYSPAFPSSGSKCNLPFNRVDILANGSVVLCMEGYKIGDLSMESLSQAWHSERAMYFRKVYNSYGVIPMCFRCCGIYDTIKF
jgi:MoaA/NifB/PqqE/SkfB family radical SAM enzyme